MEIVLIIILFCLMLYAFIKLAKIKKETYQKDTKITTLNQQIDQLKIEVSNHLYDKRSLNDKILSLRTELSNLQMDKKNIEQKNVRLKEHNDALSKYQDILNVQIECEYLLKKAEKDSIKLS